MYRKVQPPAMEMWEGVGMGPSREGQGNLPSPDNAGREGPPSESGICRGPFWGQTAAGQAVSDDGDKMVTARRQEQTQDLALGRSSLAIPVIKVITAIYYLGPHNPKY